MTDERTSSTAISLAQLVEASLAGDREAWETLVVRLERVVWKAVNMMTTDDEVRKDAFAATWLRLVERLATIREPEKLPGWLTTTATNEVRQILRQRSRRHISIDSSASSAAQDGPAIDLAQGDGQHDRRLVQEEAGTVVRQAFHVLDEDCRQLLTVLVLTDPPIAYRDAAVLLGRPVGSLGPSRQRCLDKLRNMPSLQSWRADGGG